MEKEKLEKGMNFVQHMLDADSSFTEIEKSMTTQGFSETEIKIITRPFYKKSLKKNIGVSFILFFIFAFISLSIIIVHLNNETEVIFFTKSTWFWFALPALGFLFKVVVNIITLYKLNKEN